MLAISIWQPWGQLVVDRRKPHETRHWPPPGRVLGTDIAIHAAQRLHVDEREKAKLWGYTPADLPLGAIIGVARLSSCMRTEHFMEPPHDLEYGDFSPGRWAWRLEDVRKLKTPVPCKGLQGFFRVLPDIERAVLDGLAGRTRDLKNGDRLSESELAQLMRAPR